MCKNIIAVVLNVHVTSWQSNMTTHEENIASSRAILDDSLRTDADQTLSGITKMLEGNLIVNHLNVTLLNIESGEYHVIIYNPVLYY